MYEYYKVSIKTCHEFKTIPKLNIHEYCST